MSTLGYLTAVSENTSGIDTITEDICEEKCSNFDFELDSLMCGRKQGDEVTFLCPASEDEVANVQCLLAEPQNEKLLEVEARVLKLGHEGDFGGFAYSIDCYDYAYKAYNEILNSDPLQNEGHETNLDFVDSVFKGIEDEPVNKTLHMPEHLACSSGIFTAKSSSCQEPSIDCHLQNFIVERPPHSVRTENEDNCNSVNSTFIVPKTESNGDAVDGSMPFLDEMSISELHQMFKSTFGRDTFICDKELLKRQILFGSRDSNEFSSNPFRFEGGLCSIEDDVHFDFSTDLSFPERLSELTVDQCDQNTIIAEEVVMRDGDTGNDLKNAGFEEGVFWHLDLMDKNDKCTSRKRLRKPTRRYIEESSFEKSRKYNESVAKPISAARRKMSTFEIQKPLCNEGSEVLPLMYENKFSVDSVSRMDCANRVRRGRPRKNTNYMGNGFYKARKHKSHVSESKNSYSSGISHFEPKDDISDFSDLEDRKIGVRRKHHRLWTLSEVMKLIEGVSRYGVGRWTEIKKYLFYSSTHRTSVDLKDKWRNLLRASGAHIHGKEVQKRKKQISHSIPQAVVLRVRELAVVYPYPRQRETSCDVSPATVALTSQIEE